MVGIPPGSLLGAVVGTGLDVAVGMMSPVGLEIGFDAGFSLEAGLVGVAFGSEVGFALGLAVGFDIGFSLETGLAGVGLGLDVTVGSSGSPMYFTMIPFLPAYPSA